MDFTQGLSDAWSGIVGFVPKLLGAIVIFIIGWIVAKVLASVIEKALGRVGFDRAGERGGLNRMLGDYTPSKILAKVVYWAVLLFTLQFAFGVFGPNPISDALSALIGYLPNVLAAIIILVIAGAVATIAREVIGNVMSDSPYGRTLATVAYAGVLVFGLFAAINQLRIAPEIVNALWWAVLIAAVGCAVVAFGIGGIPVARRMLENMGGGRGGAAATTPTAANVGRYQEERPTPESGTPERKPTTAEAEETEEYEPRHATPGTRDEFR